MTVRFRRSECMGQILLALIFFELSVFFIVMALELDVSPLMDSNPATVPILWAGVLAVFSLYQIVRVLKKETGPDPKRGRLDKVFSVIVLVGVCVCSMPYVGFYLATSTMIILMLLFLGEHRKRILVMSALGWSIFAWAIFERLLHLNFPLGHFWM